MVLSRDQHISFQRNGYFCNTSASRYTLAHLRALANSKSPLHVGDCVQLRGGPPCGPRSTHWLVCLPAAALAEVSKCKIRRIYEELSLEETQMGPASSAPMFACIIAEENLASHLCQLYRGSIMTRICSKSQRCSSQTQNSIAVASPHFSSCN